MKARTLTHNGKTQTVAEWATELGLNPKTINSRLRKGESVAQALQADRRTDSTGKATAARKANTPWRNDMRFRRSK